MRERERTIPSSTDARSPTSTSERDVLCSGPLSCEREPLPREFDARRQPKTSTEVLPLFGLYRLRDLQGLALTGFDVFGFRLSGLHRFKRLRGVREQRIHPHGGSAFRRLVL